MNKLSFLELNDIGIRNIWKLSWAVMISRLFYTLLSTADMFWIGKLGPQDVAAVAVTGSIFWVLYSFEGLISSGTIAITSRAAGSNNNKLLIKGFSTSVVMSLLISLILCIPSIIFSENILSLFGLTESVIGRGVPYMRIFILGIVILSLEDSIFNTFYGLGNSRIPMAITVISIVLNIVLDPFLIFGWYFFPEMGITGAALASLISLIVSLLISFTVFYRKIDISGFDFDWKIINAFLKIGIPAMFHTITRPITGLIMYRVAAIFGTYAVAAFGIGGRILNFVFIYMDALLIATQSFVGQFLGSDKKSMARKVSLKTAGLGLSIQVISTVIIFIFSRQLIAIFNSNIDVVNYGTNYLQILSISLLFYPFVASFGAAHRGSGDTRPQMIGAILANWITKIPLSLFLSLKLNLGTNGIWIAIGISVFVEALTITYFFFRGGWLKYEITEED